MSRDTSRRHALTGLLLTPFAGACSTSTAPPVDGTFLESGSNDFNVAANWSSGVVPTGTATVALQQRNTPIVVTDRHTTLKAVRQSWWAPLVIPAGGAMTLGGEGLTLIDHGTALIDGTLNGAVFVQNTGGPFSGGEQLFGNGTIVGNVACNSGTQIVPGGLEQTAAGTLTINGGYTQIGSTLCIRRGQGKIGRIDVTSAGGGSGRATLTKGAAFMFIDSESGSGSQPLPRGVRIPVLTTTNGLTGRFETVWSSKIEYDHNNAYLIL